MATHPNIPLPEYSFLLRSRAAYLSHGSILIEMFYMYVLYIYVLLEKILTDFFILIISQIVISPPPPTPVILWFYLLSR